MNAKRCLAQKEALNAYDNLRNIFTKMQDTYIRVDRDGEVEVISDSSLELLGYKSEEMLGTQLGVIIIITLRKEIFC